MLIRHFCGANIRSVEARSGHTQIYVRSRMYGKDKKGSKGVKGYNLQLVEAYSCVRGALTARWVWV